MKGEKQGKADSSAIRTVVAAAGQEAQRAKVLDGVAQLVRAERLTRVTEVINLIPFEELEFMLEPLGICPATSAIFATHLGVQGMWKRAVEFGYDEAFKKLRARIAGIVTKDLEGAEKKERQLTNDGLRSLLEAFGFTVSSQASRLPGCRSTGTQQAETQESSCGSAVSDDSEASSIHPGCASGSGSEPEDASEGSSGSKHTKPSPSSQKSSKSVQRSRSGTHAPTRVRNQHRWTSPSVQARRKSLSRRKSSRNRERADKERRRSSRRSRGRGGRNRERDREGRDRRDKSKARSRSRRGKRRSRDRSRERGRRSRSSRHRSRR